MESYFLFMGLQPLKHCLVGLTVPTKHLYHAYHRSFSDAYTVYRTRSHVYAVSCRAEPDKAGGWGCNPHTENTRCVQFCVGPKPNETKRKQTKTNENKQNETKRKRKPRQTKNQRFEAKTRFFGVVFSFHGLAAPETLPCGAYSPDQTFIPRLPQIIFRRLHCLPHSFPRLRCFLSGRARQSRGVGVQPPH